MEALSWQRPGQRVTMIDDLPWRWAPGVSIPAVLPKYGEVYLVSLVLWQESTLVRGVHQTFFALRGFRGTYAAKDFRPVDPLDQFRALLAGAPPLGAMPTLPRRPVFEPA